MIIFCLTVPDRLSCLHITIRSKGFSKGLTNWITECDHPLYVLIVARRRQSCRLLLLYGFIIIRVCAPTMSQNYVTNGLSIPQRSHQNRYFKPLRAPRYNRPQFRLI